MLPTYLGAIWARYTTHGHYHAYIKHMITRSQIAHYLCTCWTTTYAPDGEFLSLGMHLRVLRWDGERVGKNIYHENIIHIAYIIDIHVCIPNGLTVGLTGIQTHLRVISR